MKTQSRLKTLALTALVALAGIPSALADENAAPFYSRFFNLDPAVWYISHGWANGDHQSCEWRRDAATTHQGRLRLTLSDRGGDKRAIGCGEVQTHARFHYGRFEARMRAAVGSGLNSAFFTYIGPPMNVPEHDEIDFEFLGKNPRTVEVVHWTNGVRGTPKIVDLGFDASTEYHNYAFEWRPDGIKWFVDDKLVHETKPGDQIPKNPGKIFFSLWSGSPEWMGPFTYDQPVHADIVWVKYTPLIDGPAP